MTATTPDMQAAGDRLARRNAFVLALATALAGANTTVMFATGAIVGAELAPVRSLATLPISIFVVGLATASLPVGMLIQRVGRRAAYQIATIAGVLTGLFGYLGVTLSSFPIFCVATFCAGFYASAAQSYRFAAADTASDAFRPKAISWVMTGGILAGVVGPQLVVWTKDALPPILFAGTYIGQAVIALMAGVILSFIDIPKPKPVVAGSHRPVSAYFRDRAFLTAVTCGAATYMLMNFVMTAAPLAMIGCNHSVADAAYGIQWHVIAMYGPSFFTGSFIARFGAPRVVAAGLALTALSAAVALTGITVMHFYAALVLLGLGWNFGYIGASAMVAATAEPQERTRVQSINDFCVFGVMAIGSFSSGQVVTSYGWDMVNIVVFPIVALAAGALLLRQLTSSRGQAA
ncbi:MFS transporter [Phreatobacter aquaticus]|uniref:MFS transporter n=1 Tax=Phreatobacter aquaticus TaxID=2570229 RepID=A0A4D7QNI4_9HYPH|nr:MFS transporter [Phreatobacter aquaticus]QCK87169.1 MFS transporter [Phreatobacter aquaticus]